MDDDQHNVSGLSSDTEVDDPVGAEEDKAKVSSGVGAPHKLPKLG